MRLRVGAAQINPTVGDLDANASLIVDYANRARDLACDVIVFPELAVCGYPPEDLLLRPAFVAEAEEAIAKIAATVRDRVVVVGTVHRYGDLYNAAAVCWGGRVLGYYHKRFLPNYGVFDERRYFRPSLDAAPLIRVNGVTIGITICEDVWMAGGPLLEQARAGAELALNINGSPFHTGKQGWRRSMLATRAADAAMPLVFLNLVGGQDELVFDGGSMLFDAEGTLLASAPQFEETLCVWDVDCTDAFRRRLRDNRPRSWEILALPTIDVDALAADAASHTGGGDVVPIDSPPGRVLFDEGDVTHLHAVHAKPPLPEANRRPLPALDRCEEVYSALVLGARDYLRKNGFRTCVLGLSGGVDSSLVAVVAADAIGAANVTGIAMPSPYSSEGSVADARELAANLGIGFELVSITPSFDAMLQTVEPLFQGLPQDVTEENVQARLRGVILMAFSNKFGALLLTTGNKSEMAVGYCTLYGDMAGGFAVIKDVPKTLVFDLCRWRNATVGRDLIPATVLAKPPSAELRPDQKDSDSLPPYEVLDPIVEAYVERDLVAAEIVARGTAPAEIVDRVVRLVDLSEYKRRQAPPGVRITAKAFGRDRRLPLTNRFRPPSA